MIKVAFLTLYANWPWRRQFKKGAPIVGDVEFFVPLEVADVVVVYDALPMPKLKLKAGQASIFVVSEPETVKRYDPVFLGQFDAIITSDRTTPHPRRIFSHAGLPWHVGTMATGGVLLERSRSFEEFEHHFPVKKKLASVVSSDKAFTAEHRARLEFVAKLKEAFGDQIDFFGRGIVDFADKGDVLDAYRYHIALENSAIEDYWTEKLADPFLTLTFPIYHGCPNITEYFPPESLRKININEPEAAIATIKEILASDLAEQSRPNLLEARRRVMHEHNLFELLARTAHTLLGNENSVSKQGERLVRQEIDCLSFHERLKSFLKDFISSRPKLRSWLRRIRLFAERHSIQHYWRYATSEFYRSHQRWISENPDEAIRYDYDLPHDARVLDVGGYRGDFAKRFLEKYGASVTICEPVPKFASQIRNRFSHEPRIMVHEFGLSDRNEQVAFDLSADASGVFGSSAGPKVTVLLRDAKEFLLETGVPEWHLLKLNIEGGEYALLERLIETGLIDRMQHLQVQFHLHVPDAKAKYKRIAERLRRTHRLEWRYPFVWESWRRLHDNERKR